MNDTVELGIARRQLRECQDEVTRLRELAQTNFDLYHESQTELGAARDQNDILQVSISMRPDREIVPAVAVQLTDEADWEQLAALCGGELQTGSDPSGEYVTTLTIPGCPNAAGEYDWLVQHQDGSWSVHSEWTDVAVVPPDVESYVEIGGQRMTEAQFEAARRPLLDGVASAAEADRLREVWGPVLSREAIERVLVQSVRDYMSVPDADVVWNYSIVKAAGIQADALVTMLGTQEVGR